MVRNKTLLNIEAAYMLTPWLLLITDDPPAASVDSPQPHRPNMTNV